jgi:hypothetical protein
MILNQRHKSPVISFGLALTVLSCEIGDEVNIWQNEIYNGNEYFLEQDEIPNEIQLRYNTLANPVTDFFITFIQEPTLYNGRVYFESTLDSETVNIVWNTDGWYLVLNLDTSFDVLGRIPLDLPLPISDQWTDFEPSLTLYSPRETTLTNSNSQGFKMEATETKQIQVAIVNKRTGEVLKSNIIQLIVNES